MDEMSKEVMAYTLKYSVIKKDTILPFVTWLDLEGVSQPEKNKYSMISLIYGFLELWR